ncbi:alpha/beta fold hydrolase [Streptomyces sp. NBC_01465]|uniref:alpha/beta fold hydrolase n=1 Tax=Streptomyces sp. NBC_01465 TaxID=2903878 RepID=UPI002E307B23|nr:alpha/beta fold hydrolase [Streptomyces sp. NBC_01465]
MSELTLPAPTFARTVRGSGPGLLLAHGAGGGIEANYGPILDGLAAHRTVVGADYPGSGATPRADAPFDPDELADQLVAAAVAEGLETFAISGFSLGGPVAIRAAARHPERVTALVLTATFAHADAKLALAAAIWRRLYEAGDHALLAEFLTYAAFGHETLNAIPADALREAIELTAGSLPAGTPEQTELVGRIDVREDLAGISAPTLVITTTGDPLVPAALQRQLAAGIPGARTADIATGHLPFAERPEEWQKLIVDFLG